MQTPKAILFDAGNTLLECHPSMGEVVGDVVRAEGLELSPEQRLQTQRIMFRHYAHAQATRGLKTSVDETWDFWREVYLGCCRDLGIPRPEHYAQQLVEVFTRPNVWRPYDDVLPTLERLAIRGVRMGVISNWSTGLHGIMEGLGLRPYFEFVVTSAEAGWEKPERGIYAAAFAGFDLAPADCVYVGDSADNDYYSSVDFGMDFALIDRDDRHGHLPCRRLRDLRDLLSLVEKVG